MRTEPKIRFKEFTDAWEQRKLGGHAIIKGRLGWKSLKQEEYTLEGPSMIAGKHIVNGKIDWTKVDHIPDWRYDESPEIMLENEDIIFSKDGSLGNPAVINNLTVKATINSTMMLVRTDKSIDSNFFYQILTGEAFDRLIYLKVSGSSIPHLFQADMNEFEFLAPSLQEQRKISTFLSSADSLIALHQRKLEELKSFKSTMLSKMFPKHGQTVPEIRLAGFDGEWEKTKLRDVSERVQGNDGRMDLPTLTISAAQGWLSQKDRFSQNIAGKEQKNYTLLKRGELSYNHGNSKLAKYGVVFELNNYEEALVPRVYHSFKVNELANPRFIETMFATKQPDRELRKLVSSGARMDGLLNINYDDFMGISIIIPTVHEQETIGEFFSNLDDLISSTQLKIEELETLKKKLLQEMFV